VIPSKESELTGGLMMVIKATPSAPTSIVVLPLVLLIRSLLTVSLALLLFFSLFGSN
jgi:hypothetical protein